MSSYTDDDHKEWDEFKVTHFETSGNKFLNVFFLQNKFKKTYDTADEDLKRKEIYFQNKQYVEEHNKRHETGEVTWKMGINQFSDLSKEEFQKRFK